MAHTNNKYTQYTHIAYIFAPIAAHHICHKFEFNNRQQYKMATELVVGGVSGIIGFLLPALR